MKFEMQISQHIQKFEMKFVKYGVFFFKYCLKQLKFL